MLKERGEDGNSYPDKEDEQKQFLRTIFNLRMPKAASEEFLQIEGEYLEEEIRKKGIVDVITLPEIEEGISLYLGDITALKADCIVNAANDALLGCFRPNHYCIDNAIHTYSGIELRLACYEIMKIQGHREKTGTCKITPAFHLPSKYILHTVGPIVRGKVTEQNREDLASCYRSCLEMADSHGLKSIVFCSISTGVFGFPINEAAKIALATVRDYRKQKTGIERVIFDVFSERDYDVYEKLF